MQCDAKSSVADAKAMFILDPELLEFSAAATAAKAAASPATETVECVCAFSTRALSFFFNMLMLDSLWWNHFPNDPILRALAEFINLTGCNKEKGN
jgi:hypothetical protein